MFFLCAQVIDGLDGRELTMFFNRKYAITIVLSLRVLSEIIREWVLSQIQLCGDVRSGVVTTWYEDEETCILHVRQDMIEKRWVNGVHIPKSSKMFIEIMLEKFYILDRDNRTVLSLEQ